MRLSGLSNILNIQGKISAADAGRSGLDVGGLMQGAAALYTASDIRLKTNIKPTGIDSRTNLPTYEFAYKAAPTLRYRGVMAQDVEKLYPQAVSEDASGYKRVRYDMLGMSMERVRS
jgi:hypothetical protein